MKTLPFPFLLISIFLLSCGGSGNKTTDNTVSENDTISAELNIKLEPLKDEVLKLKRKDPFNAVIELKGEQFVVDSLIFQPAEIEMVIKDNLMVIRTRNRVGKFVLLSLPELQLIKSFGSIGLGPNELLVPKLCRNT